MISKILNLNIKDQVKFFLEEGILKNEKTELRSLSDLISALIVVHIKYWQFEDNIEEIDDPSTVGRLKQGTNSLFKVERPDLIKAIDGIIMGLLKGEDISKMEECDLVLSISSHINEMGSDDKFDLIYSDTLSELIDKLVIIQIRRWHIEKSSLENPSEGALLRLKTIDDEKIPMLLKSLDKLLLLIARGKVNFIPVNVKFYKGVNK